jgi:hypothetical protein
MAAARSPVPRPWPSLRLASSSWPRVCRYYQRGLLRVVLPTLPCVALSRTVARCGRDRSTHACCAAAAAPAALLLLQSNDEFSYMRGAFLTIDRPYGPIFDYLHHKIGSTHVAHHIDCTIPHYHAREATDAIAKAFPKAYLYDPTPVHKALWRVACNCFAVKGREDGRYLWAQPGRA